MRAFPILGTLGAPLAAGNRRRADLRTCRHFGNGYVRVRNGNTSDFEFATLLAALLASSLGGCGDGPIVGPGLEPPVLPAGSQMASAPAAGISQSATAGSGAFTPASAGNVTAPPPAVMNPTGGRPMPGAMPIDAPAPAEPDTGPDVNAPEPAQPAVPAGMAAGPADMSDPGASADPAEAMDPDPGADLPVCDSAEAVPLAVEMALLPVLAGPSSALADQWGPLRSGLSAFFAEPESAGLSVGLYSSAGAGLGMCPSTSRLLAPYAELPQAAVTLDLSLLAATGVAGGREAIADVLAQARARQGLQAGRQSTVVLLTDAEPTMCEGSGAELAALAAQANAGDRPVRTYVIAFGDYAASYDEVAAAGGTNLALQVALEAGALADAMRTIRREERDCTFGLPEMAGGFDASLMRLTLSEANGEVRSVLGVSDRDACAGGEGFYFDRPRAPTRIHVCPAVCEELGAGASLQTETLCSSPTGE